mmetsp:Transcript_36042/g.102962  ORF Transcript_36042/g.102962 Transcript_36042/m.102962 type:complete len:106 (+) Transcript_36042:49-366(+)
MLHQAAPADAVGPSSAVQSLFLAVHRLPALLASPRSSPLDPWGATEGFNSLLVLTTDGHDLTQLIACPKRRIHLSLLKEFLSPLNFRVHLKDVQGIGTVFVISSF